MRTQTRSGTAVVMAAAVLAFSLDFKQSAASPPPVELFERPSEIELVSVSPDGTYLTAYQRSGDAYAIVTYTIQPDLSLRVLNVVRLGQTTRLVGLAWATGKRLVATTTGIVTSTDMRRARRGNFKFYRRQVNAFDADGANLKHLLQEDRAMRDALYAGLLAVVPDDPDHVVMNIIPDGGARTLSVYKVNIHTGTAELLARGDAETRDWLTDSRGSARLKFNRFGRTGLRWEATTPGGDWETIQEFRTYHRKVPFRPVAASERPGIVLVSALSKNRREALFEFDVARKSMTRQIYAHPAVDFDSPLFERLSGKLIGVRIVVDKPRNIYFDEAYKILQTSLEAAFGADQFVRGVSFSTGSRHVVEVTGPREPGAYYLFDSKQQKMALIGRANKELDPRSLGRMSALTYKARDGLQISAYLTIPPGSSGKNLPLIVMPHGGPELRDTLTYDPWAQFLATRGYAVLQPNFRGSSGYGEAFAEAGYGQWGLKMQDDVTDGVRHLIETGVADPGRICIVGASYGGYAALAGAAFTPDLYKCAVSIAGVSDLVMSQTTEFEDRSSYRYWRESIGNPFDEAVRRRLEKTSPIHFVDNIRAPILLIHGEEDRIVRVQQSRIMRDALKRAGKPHEYLELEKVGHDFWRRPTFLDDFDDDAEVDSPEKRRKSRVQVLEKVEAFLARYLPTRQNRTARVRKE